MTFHPSRLQRLLVPILAAAFPAHAGITYVDATSGPGGNTTLADLTGFPHEAAAGIGSQGGSTRHTFPFPMPLRGAPKAFFRVETE